MISLVLRALGAGQDLKSFDVDNKYGADALKRILNDCTGESNTLHGVQVSLCLIWHPYKFLDLLVVCFTTLERV